MSATDILRLGPLAIYDAERGLIPNLDRTAVCSYCGTRYPDWFDTKPLRWSCSACGAPLFE